MTNKTNQKPSLLIIEDHKIVALGLKTLIRTKDNLGVVDFSTTAKDALKMATAHPYDLYIIDVELPDMSGIDLMKSLKVLSPDSYFIFHTIHYESWILFQIINNGANSIVLKDDDPNELSTAIDNVLKGENYFSNRYQEYCQQIEDKVPLTERQIEILRLIADGVTTKDIAETLFVSQNTIEFHRKHIMHKLNASNMAQLVKEGIAKGYINVKK